jgi:hypothetical protein
MSLATKGNLPNAKLAMLPRRNAYIKLTEFMQSTDLRDRNLSTNKVDRKLKLEVSVISMMNFSGLRECHWAIAS